MTKTYQHRNGIERTSLSGASVAIFRAVFFCVGLAVLNANIGAELSIPFLFGAGLAGGLTGLWCANSRLSNRGFTSTILLGALAWGALRYTLDQINPGSSAFGWYATSRSGELYIVIYTALAVFEWLYRRTQSWLTVEAFIISAIAVSARAPHRQFRLDAPRAIAEVAWNWNSNPIGVFIGVGSILTLLLFGFVSVCAKPRAQQRERITSRAVIGAAVSALGLVLLVSFVAFRLTTVAAGSRLMNGVGQDNSEGVSPLSFHSALGASNQPAAIVRLEGDYTDNPHSPMLYLREDALSTFNGSELVQAGGAYDRDVIKTPPDQAFKADDSSIVSQRFPLPHSVYLLAEHKIPSAVDFPASLVPLRNPNPGKFKGGAYRVYSQAPLYKLQELSGAAVGDPRWDEIERQHYLQKNPDQRYTDLAVDITARTANPVERAAALASYLSEKSIYTLSPNHEVNPGDQTAPYLFGDMRGYCVHFAHAMVYMLRSIGIPSRIGTGYLTDLSQAKDGHILLRMSDRHAWAEVYVTEKGWVPFDVQPTQVESHGDSEVDQKLLEDLMSQLDPGEEILPKEPSKPEPGLARGQPIAWSEYLPGGFTVLLAFTGVLACTAGLKLFLKHIAWRLPISFDTRVRLAYRAQALNTADLGVTRQHAETRSEFETRARRVLSSDPVSLTRTLNAIRFGASDSNSVGLDAAKSLDIKFLAPRSVTRRLWTFFSPFTLRRYFSP